MSEPWSSTEGRHAMRVLWQLATTSRKPVVAEIAREVTSGRMSPRDVVLSGAYDEHVRPGLMRAVEKWLALPAAEHDRHRANAGEANQKLIEFVNDNEETLLARAERRSPRGQP